MTGAGPGPGSGKALRPGAPACRFCGAALSPHQAVRGVCDAPACETRLVQDAARAVFRRNWESHVAAQRDGIRRAAGTIAAAVARLDRPADDIAFGVVPHQEQPVVPLPEARRAAFAAHLEEITARAFTAGAPEVDLPRRERAEGTEAPVLDAACATCQGKCCLLGGATHAFLDRATVDLYRKRHPQARAAEIVAHYLAWLPAVSVRHSCVYHGLQGCVLPRHERADICNRYHCNPQMDLMHRYRDAGAGAAVIVAAQPGTEPAVAIFDAAGWHPVPPGEGTAGPAGLAARVEAVALAQMPTALSGESAPAEPRPMAPSAPDAGA